MPRLTVEALQFPGVGPVDLSLEAGQCASLSGASGTGKSRLLRAIADLDPHEGSASVDGAACESMPGPVWRRQVGLLRADSCWWRDRAGAHFATPPGEELERVGLSREILDRDVTRLSSGERQRLALVRLLAGHPVVLLLDEPTSHLDAAAVRIVEDLVRELCRDSGVCVLWVTHDVEQAGRVADLRFHLADGRLARSSCS